MIRKIERNKGGRKERNKKEIKKKHRKKI